MATGPKVRVIFNQKGGVGKTTLAVNLAAATALKGKLTLLIDSDPQGNSTHYLLGDKAEKLEKNIGDFYENCLGLNLFRQSIAEYITTDTGVKNLHLVGADRDLEDLRNKLENKHKIHKLRDGIKNTPYEYIYFDPPPAKDFYSLSCLIAADEIIVPIDCDAFSVNAAREILEMVTEVKQDHNPDLRILGVVVNQFQKGTKHATKIISDLEKIGFQVLEPYIPSSIKVRESHSESSPVIVSYPSHPVSLAIKNLCKNIELHSQQFVPTIKENAVEANV